jgi:hypothetical protein
MPTEDSLVAASGLRRNALKYAVRTKLPLPLSSPNRHDPDWADRQRASLAAEVP